MSGRDFMGDPVDIDSEEKGFFTEEKTEYGDIYRYNKEGQFHNTRGPAIIYTDGSVCYYQNGKPHRTDGPAYIGADGYEEYWVNGKLHRTDGPAVIRADGPAVIRADGSVEYWVNGEELSEEEFNEKYELGKVATSVSNSKEVTTENRDQYLLLHLIPVAYNMLVQEGGGQDLCCGVHAPNIKSTIERARQLMVCLLEIQK